jgi:predicted aldo/keto reductase-like oxidoreductase
LFIVSKASRARTVAEVEERLATSLERMNIAYIDLYYAPHGADDPAQFTDELKQWAESAKKRKLIRFFGFSTHSNMAKCLAAAAKLGWIDVIMPRFNFRVMQDPQMQTAMDACHKANIGLVAMKTTGKTTIKRFRKEIETEAEKKMVAHFLQRGFTPEQAAIRLVLADERVSSAPVQMENTAILTQNVAAVLDKTELTQADREVFKEYAEATCSGYCAGCAYICDSALADAPYISDIMRYLMYYNSYGERHAARELFAQIPGSVRDKLLNMDYSLAEARCPQHLPIGELIAEAVSKLA